MSLQHWAVILSTFSKELEYRPSTKISIVDALSRLSIHSNKLEKNLSEEQSVMIITASEIPLTLKIIPCESQKEPILLKVYQNIFANIKFDTKNNTLIPYTNICSELNINHSCV